MDVEQTMKALGLAVAKDPLNGTQADANTKSSVPLQASFYDELKYFSANNAVILDGPNGNGKTFAVHRFAEESGAKLQVQQGYRTLAVEDIRGTRGLNEKGTTFVPGPLILSLLDPNGWYLLEEANMVSPDITSLLHNLLDGTNEIMVPELGKAVKRRKSWRCFMTRNPGYAGTTEMNRALESRCVVIETDHFSRENEIRMIAEKYPQLGDRVDTIVDMAQAVRAARENGEHEFEMDIRACLQLAEAWMYFGDALQAFRFIVLPKIGDRYSYVPVRNALLDAVNLIVL